MPSDAPLIQRLPEELANKIAAGEVVDRPSSVAREVVENSLDAKATRIDVLVGDGGRTIRISDNGVGMSAQQAPLAFERFATSKIRSADDLFCIETMGFRGEALAAIAAVSRVELKTRQAGADRGTLLRIEGGSLLASGPYGCPDGSSLEVSDLFFNTPARLKFLKSAATETAHVIESVTALALAHPEVAVTITSSTRKVLDTSGARDLAETAALVLGDEVGPRMLNCRVEAPAACIEGLVAPPELIRGDRTKQWIFINGRPIKHPALARAVEEAFSGQIPASRFPIYVLRMTVPPERVDFNVSPTKKEVRLQDGSTLYALMRQTVAAALRQLPAARRQPSWQFSSPGTSLGQLMVNTSETYHAERTSSEGQSYLAEHAAALPVRMPARQRPSDRYEPESLLPSWQSAALASVRQGGDIAPETPLTRGREDFPWQELVLLGQIHATYLVLQHPDGLYLVDQHNSHERYLYERLVAQRDGLAQQSQALLLPIKLDLSPGAESQLQVHRQSLATIGFRIEPVPAAPSQWQLEAAPTSLPLEEAEATLMAMLERYDNDQEAALASSDRLLVTLACHSATKAGKHLDQTAMRRLLTDWMSCEQPFTCPHGRPTAFLIPTSELHRRCLRGMQTR